MPSKLDEIQKELPCLPGYAVHQLKPQYHKPHFCDFADGVRVVRRTDSKDSARMAPGTESDQANGTDMIPAWVAFDKMVLRFYGQYVEQLRGAVGDEKSRTHKYVTGAHIVVRSFLHSIILFFYLEDDTAQISEPRVPNSGLVQGNLLRRQRIPLTDKEGEEQYLSSKDLNVGVEITLLSKTFKLMACDAFTRSFLEEARIHVPENQMDITQFTTHKSDTMKQKATHAAVNQHPKLTFKQFLDYDGQVLRFYCIWENIPDLYGHKKEVHHMIMHYFLADDTIEVRERLSMVKVSPDAGAGSCGHNATTQFLRRHRVPKHPLSMSMDGSNLGPNPIEKDAYYTFKDLKVGAALEMYGKIVILCDCDEFTKKYLNEKMGHSHNPIPIERFDSYDPATGEIKLKPLPAASNDDTADDQTEFGSLPGTSIKEPKKKGVDDKIVLRFSALLKTDDPLDKQRRFVVTYHYVDNTFIVYEKTLLNSGIPGGKYLERTQIKKPGYRANYSAKDLALGAELVFFGRTFVLKDLDSFTRVHVERNPQIFPKLASPAPSQP